MPFRSQFIILFMCYFSMLTFCSFDLFVTNKIVEFTTIYLLSSVSFDFFFEALLLSACILGLLCLLDEIFYFFFLYWSEIYLL